MLKLSPKIIIIAAFFAIYVIWGSTYLLNKIAVSEISPFFLAGTRFTVAGILTLIIAKSLKLDLTITKKQLINSTVAGFLFLVFGNGVFVWALKYVDSGFAALEASTQPLFVLLLMRLIDGKKIQRKSLIGITLGFIGMYLLVSQKELVAQENSLLGMLMILTCILSWSFASIFVSKADFHANYFVNSAYQMLSAGILLYLSSFILGETWVPPMQWSLKVQWSMFLLIIFGSIIAFTAFNYLLKVVSTEKVSTFSYVNPLIALSLGWYILDEKLTFQTIIAAAILLTGVYFITSKKETV